MEIQWQPERTVNGNVDGRLRFIFFLFLLLAVAAGCTAGLPAGPGHKPGGLEPAVTLEENFDSKRGEIAFEIVDPDSLEGELGEKLGGVQAEYGVKTVKHGGYVYILVSAGRKPTEGYAIRVAYFTFKTHKGMDGDSACRMSIT